ncbi:MAG TPA: hypothetical protein VFC87_08255 [Perlabentimonas sp.]|nr:hypothetical protein [Bacteroidales bacterium]MDD4672656.1 hypothetical protein [Bacteroidales bacterium]MDY0347991.1 hypothetical protein [Tenuifilaceae bacterium]HZJ74782.1 hypothetical protein [Perlabentimonas sp.]
MKRILLPQILVLLSVIVFSACDNTKESPYIILKGEDALEITTDTVYVDLNTVRQLLVEVGYKGGGDPFFLRQIDGGDIIDLRGTDDFELISESYSSIKVQKAVVTTHFSDDLMQNGSVVIVTVRISTDYSKSVCYRVN